MVTVAPRYQPYPDTEPTGLSVPLDLPDLHLASHVFEDDDAGSDAGDAGDQTTTTIDARSLQRIPPSDDDDQKQKQQQQQQQNNEKEALLFYAVPGSNHGNNEVCRVFVDHPALRTENIYGPSVTSNNNSNNNRPSLTYMEAGDTHGLEQRYNILCQAALGAAALMPCLRPSSSSASIVFVANDWPTALLMLRLKYVLQRHRHPHSYPHRRRFMGQDSLAMHLLNGSSRSRASSAAAHRARLCSFTDILATRLATAATAYCIHNLAYHGVFSSSLFPHLCLPEAARSALDMSSDWKSVVTQMEMEGRAASPVDASPTTRNQEQQQQQEIRNVECGCPPSNPCICPSPPPPLSLSLPLVPGGGDLNFMRAALLCSDQLVTVSPNYAEEIQQQPRMACGMLEILQSRGVVYVFFLLFFSRVYILTHSCIYT